MGSKLRDLAGSRKFYAGIIGVVLVYVNSQVGLLDPGQMQAMCGVIASWIIGQSIVDAKKA